MLRIYLLHTMLRSYVTFKELLWNYEFIIMKISFTENTPFYENFIVRKFGAIQHLATNITAENNSDITNNITVLPQDSLLSFTVIDTIRSSCIYSKVTLRITITMQVESHSCMAMTAYSS